MIAHRRLKIRPTRDQRWNMVVLPVGSVQNIPEIMARTGLAQAAHIVTRTYTREEGCVTNALKQLYWPTLEKRRQVARLTLMYKCVTSQAAIDIPCYVQHQSFLKTRASHPLKFIPLQPSWDTVQIQLLAGNYH